MKYNHINSHNNYGKYLVIISFVCVVIISYFNYDYLKRSVSTIYLGSLYDEFLNEKAGLINYFNNINLDRYNFMLSKNNYVRLQQERAKMINNYKSSGNQWAGENQYFKSKILIGDKNLKGELKLFGMNSDHFRSQNGHSFRVKYKKAGEKFGNRKFNYINPRSRDFNSDFLLNLIYNKLYDGIRIHYKPVEVYLNKNRFGIMLEESFFDKYLIETNSRRESVIFEFTEDGQIHFNYIDNKNESDYSGYILDLYRNDYEAFLNKIDLNKLKSVIILGLISNNAHPFSTINLHWYYNPVSDLIEPTIRESFTTSLKNYNIEAVLNEIIENNPIIKDLFLDSKNIFFRDLNNNLTEIENIINYDSEYLEFKQKMIGFSDKINEREMLLKYNISALKKQSFKKEINKKSQRIEITKDTLFKGEVIFGENTEVVISPGVNVMMDSALLKIKGKFKAVGTEKFPIIFNGIGKSGTIYFENNDQVDISFVSFKNLSNQNSKQTQPSSVTFHNSKNINITYSKFERNIVGDDFINFFKSSNVLIKECLFKDIKSDALDSDFSEIKIINSKFINIGNDAIDGSGSNIFIKNCYFNNIKDKAISAGENSQFQIEEGIIENSEIGIVTKDFSNITVKNIKLKNNSLDFSSFIKKDFYGNSKAVFYNTTLYKYLIEEGSEIIGLENITYSTKVEKKLYGNLYGKASEK